jgi:hypothetical protein
MARVSRSTHDRLVGIRTTSLPVSSCPFFLHQNNQQVLKAKHPSTKHKPLSFPSNLHTHKQPSPQNPQPKIQWPPLCTDHPSPAPSTPPMLPSPPRDLPPQAPEQSTHATPRASLISLTLHLPPRWNRKRLLAARPSPEPSTPKTRVALP